MIDIIKKLQTMNYIILGGNKVDWELAYEVDSEDLYQALINEDIPIPAHIFSKILYYNDGYIQNIPEYLSLFMLKTVIDVKNEELTPEKKNEKENYQKNWKEGGETLVEQMKLEAYTAVNFNDLKTLTVLKFLGYNFDNFTIHLAAIKGHFEMVKWLEKNTRVFPLASTSYTCIKNGHPEIAVFLVKHYPKDCVKHVNIQYATKYGCLDMFKDIYDISDLTEKTKQDVIYAFLTPNN